MSGPDAGGEGNTMSRKRILVIYTGGTIGMTSTDHGYAPQKEAFHALLQQIPELYAPVMPEWEMVDMDPLLDSSNITVLEWNAIGGFRGSELAIKRLGIEGNLKAIEMTFKGNLAALDVSPLETAILKGVFSASMQGVNFVNAPIIAKKNGIDVSTLKSETTGDYKGSITVKLITDKDTSIVSGALIAKGVKRIVKVGNFNTSIEPEEHMLLVPHENKPSMIAKVSTVIGEDGVNINHMSVSPSDDKQLSIMIISTESEVDNKTLEEITKIDGVHKATYVHLG